MWLFCEPDLMRNFAGTEPFVSLDVGFNLISYKNKAGRKGTKGNSTLNPNF